MTPRRTVIVCLWWVVVREPEQQFRCETPSVQCFQKILYQESRVTAAPLCNSQITSLQTKFGLQLAATGNWLRKLVLLGVAHDCHLNTYHDIDLICPHGGALLCASHPVPISSLL